MQELPTREEIEEAQKRADAIPNSELPFNENGLLNRQGYGLLNSQGNGNIQGLIKKGEG